MTKVKICGLFRPEDVQAVNHCMPDYAGFVFAHGSRRQVDERTAYALRAQMSPEIETVGVFVNQPVSLISRLYHAGTIGLVQLHGDEDGAYVAALRRVCNAPVIRALSVGESMPALPADTDFLLFDTASAQRGGTGQSFEWRMLRGYEGKPYFLAGGLHPGNVAKAIQLLAPFGVDVSSGVETDGVKDAEKMARFVECVRGRQDG